MKLQNISRYGVILVWHGWELCILWPWQWHLIGGHLLILWAIDFDSDFTSFAKFRELALGFEREMKRK
jgi:hypothetical protein